MEGGGTQIRSEAVAKSYGKPETVVLVETREIFRSCSKQEALESLVTISGTENNGSSFP